MIVMAWVACVSPERVAEEQARIGQATADALGLALVASEWTSHARSLRDPRHVSDCGCPCVERFGTETSYVHELDYADPPCLPWSGLLPSTTTGHVWLDVDRDTWSITRAQALIGGQPTAATLAGQVLDDSGLSVSIEGDLQVGDALATLSLGVARDRDHILLDGDVRFDDLTLWLDGVTLPRDQRAASVDCPTPVAGRARTEEGSLEPAHDGLRISWRGHTSQAEACAWLAPFLER